MGCSKGYSARFALVTRSTDTTLSVDPKHHLDLFNTSGAPWAAFTGARSGRLRPGVKRATDFAAFGWTAWCRCSDLTARPGCSRMSPAKRLPTICVLQHQLTPEISWTFNADYLIAACALFIGIAARCRHCLICRISEMVADSANLLHVGKKQIDQAGIEL